MRREPTVDDVRALMGASSPHFALHIRNRIRNLIDALPATHPARVQGEREIGRLERLAVEGEARGPDEGEPRLPSLKIPPGEASGSH